MCGIAGYVGPRNAVDVVFDQLKRLEYRGYDSAGLAYVDEGRLHVLKKAGKLTGLGSLLAESKPSAHTAIAHSRWATHGGPTDLNAHPHHDQDAQISVIHNGIIENYLELKSDLVSRGHTFHSETDTEVAAHVIGEEYRDGVELVEAVRRAVAKLRGAFAFVVVSSAEPGTIVCARNASPLIVGFGEGESMVASDIPALLPYTRRVAILENDMVAKVTVDAIKFYSLEGKPIEPKPFDVDWDAVAAEKGGFEHFMIKEVHEQPEVVHQCLAGRVEGDHVKLDGLFSDHVWHEIDRINIIACGTAYHAGLMGKWMFERMLQLPVDVFYSSEFRYGEPLLSPRSLAIFVSQSGETADSLAALRLCKARRIRTLGVVNVVGSSIARDCDRVLYTQAGPEISVASTKAYTAQVLVLLLLVLHIAQVREMPGVRVPEIVQDLRGFAESMRQSLDLEPQVKALAERFKDSKMVFFLGRNADAHVALEAALKLKEIAYIPTQECPAGELKHGPLALVEPGVLAVFGATDPDTQDKLLSNMKEVQARGGTVVAVTTNEASAWADEMDTVLRVASCETKALAALSTIVPLQLLAYHLANLRGCEIDQPRNLAKSVTVE
ncbi:MAG: glutamine--fructose-6-phosphate transaminase (isomerizing) [Armatimonadetes bacterium]|nr:glutamine--fructose-6-phosphate transaminase (isomerizing) [Armatimonadota bacterium]